jgi:transposase
VTTLLPPGVRILLASEPADLRRSFDGLAQLARDVVREDPLSGHLFVFRNKAGRRVKILFWDRTGFALWHKRLESGVFRFPSGDAPSVEVTAAQLRLLLDGIELGGRSRRRDIAPAE